MAITLAPGDRLQFRIWCSDNEQASVNTVYYRVDSVTGASETDVAAAVFFDTQVAAAMKALLTTGVMYDGVQCRVANRLPLPVAQSGTVNAGVGTAGAPGLPRQSAGLLKFETDLAGPGARGRLYLPFPCAPDNETLGKPTAGYITRATALGTQLDNFTVIGSGPDTANVTWCVYSKVHARMQKITSFGVDLAWATMKKRGSFGRANVSPI